MSALQSLCTVLVVELKSRVPVSHVESLTELMMVEEGLSTLSPTTIEEFNVIEGVEGDLMAFGSEKLKFLTIKVMSSRFVVVHVFIEFDMYQSWWSRTTLSTTACATPVSVACSRNWTRD